MSVTALVLLVVLAATFAGGFLLGRWQHQRTLSHPRGAADYRYRIESGQQLGRVLYRGDDVKTAKQVWYANAQALFYDRGHYRGQSPEDAG